MIDSSRRGFLGGCLGLMTGGCISASDSSKGSHLGEPLINNRHDEPHSVDFRVTWEGEVVHGRTYEIAANDPDDGQIPGALPEQTWPDGRGQFTVSARLAGEAWHRVDPADAGYPACFAPKVDVDPGGTLAIFTGGNANLCDDVSG